MKNLIRVIIFILLKVIELVGIVVSYLLISKLGYAIIHSINKEDISNRPELWYNFIYCLAGLFVLGLITLILLVLDSLIKNILPNWIKSNWDFTKRLIK